MRTANVRVIRVLAIIGLALGSGCGSDGSTASADLVKATVVEVENSADGQEALVTIQVVNSRSEAVQAECKLRPESDSYPGVTMQLDLEPNETWRDTVKLFYTGEPPEPMDLSVVCSA